MLELVPMTLKEANAFVEQNRRHHKPVTGHKFSIGLSNGKEIVGVAYRIYTLRDMGYDPYVMVYDKPHAPKEIKHLQ